MDNPKILLSNATSYKAVVVSTFLKKTYPAVKIYMCDSCSASKFFHTRYTDGHIVLKSKMADENSYRDEILDVINRYAIDIFIPINSREMEIFLSRRSGFEAVLSYWGDYGAFKMLNEKDKLYKLCVETGIKTPQIFENIESVMFPVVIKPKIASAAKGVSYISNISEYRRHLKTGADMAKNVIQQYIKGVGVGYSVFAVDGKIKVGYGHRRLAEYPVNGGSSMYRTSFDDERMIGVAQKLLDATKWSGFAMFEFKLTDDGELYLIEVNPRIWGSINQGLQNGVNYFSTLLGVKDTVAKKKTDTYFSPFVYLSFLLYALRGDFVPLWKFLANLPNNKSDINLFSDPCGWSGSFLRLI